MKDWLLKCKYLWGLVNYAKSLIFVEKTGKKKEEKKRHENCVSRHPAKDLHVKNMVYPSFSEYTGYTYV